METNLVGKSIRITVPVTVATSLETFPESQALQEFFEKIFTNRLRSLPNLPEGALENYIPHMSNVMFMPIILTKMIEKNTTFTDACKNAVPEMRSQANELLTFFRMAEIDSSIKSLFDGIIDTLFKGAGDMIKVDPSTAEPKEITVSLQQVSAATAISVHVSGAVFVADKIANNPEVVKVIHATYITPLRNVIRETLTDSITISELDLDEDDIEEITNQIESMLLDSFDLIPLETVISIGIQKAISDNTTLEKAISDIGTNNLIQQATEKVMKNTDFSKYEEQLKQLITSLLTTMQLAANEF